MLHLLLIALALCAASVDLDGDGDTDQLLKDFNTGFSQSTKGLYSKTKGELLANANEWASKEHVGEAKAAFKMAEQSSALDNLEASLDGSARMDLGEGPTQAASEKDRLPQKEGKSGTQSEAGLHHDMASPHIDDASNESRVCRPASRATDSDSARTVGTVIGRPVRGVPCCQPGCGAALSMSYRRDFN